MESPPNRWLVPALFLAVGLAFLPVLAGDFLNLDDQAVVTENPHIRSLSLSSLGRLFLDPGIGLYYAPLTHLTYALEFRLFGLDPGWFHLTNLLLHLMATWLAFRLALALGSDLPAAGVCALLFGLHPTRVDSVAWIAERKDMLCACFYLAGLWLHIRRPANEPTGPTLGVALCYLAALLAKPMAVTFPFVLALLDWYQHPTPLGTSIPAESPGDALRTASGQMDRGEDPGSRSSLMANLKGKAWMLLPAILLTLATIHSHRLVGRIPLPMTVLQRVVTPFFSLGYLVRGLLVPVDLPSLLPFSQYLPWLFAPVALPLYLLAGLSLALVWWNRHDREVRFAGLFSLLTVAPVLQAIPFGLEITANRFSYLPAFGLFWWVGRHWPFTLTRGRRAAGVALLLVLAVATWMRCGLWKDSLTFWEPVIRQTGIFEAWHGRGLAWLQLGEPAAAREDFLQALRLDPRDPEALTDLAKAEKDLGRLTAARRSAEAALQVRPSHAPAQYVLGLIELRLGRLDQAIEAFTAAILAAPAFPDPVFNRGIAFLQLRRWQKAGQDFDAALLLFGEDPRILWQRALAREGAGDSDGAAADRTRALALGFNPDAPP